MRARTALYYAGLVPLDAGRADVSPITYRDETPLAMAVDDDDCHG